MLTRQWRLPLPMTVSISQWPISVLCSAATWRSLMCRLPGSRLAAVVGAVALAALLASAPQVGVERAAEVPVDPDVAIDGLMADREQAVAA